MAKSAMSVKVEGKELVIRLPINKPLVPSKSGKSLIVATTSGNKAVDCKIDGKILTLGVNAYVKDE